MSRCGSILGVVGCVWLIQMRVHAQGEEMMVEAVLSCWLRMLPRCRERVRGFGRTLACSFVFSLGGLEECQSGLVLDRE